MLNTLQRLTDQPPLQVTLFSKDHPEMQTYGAQVTVEKWLANREKHNSRNLLRKSQEFSTGTDELVEGKNLG